MPERAALTRDPDRLLLVAGPCLLESEALALSVAQRLAALARSRPALQVVFKSSYDKANRSSAGSPRGPGLETGLAWLQRTGEATGLPLLTDFHEPAQAAPVAEVCDVLQVPAFLCRQTDMLVAAAQTGRVVNVKKGQFLSPMEMSYVVNKLDEAHEVWLTERGTSFGYQNLVVDMRSFGWMGGHGHAVIFDATHSVQLPGAGSGVTAGQREFVPALARAALAAGGDGLFLETHPQPEAALSDAACQWPLDQLEALVDDCLAIWAARRERIGPS